MIYKLHFEVKGYTAFVLLNTTKEQLTVCCMFLSQFSEELLQI